MGISVIVPTYNNTKYLEECINSIYASAKERDYELLIGIDACEKTLDHIKTLKLNSKTKVFFFQKNGGPYLIKNTLTKVSKFDKVLFFDSDDVMRDIMIPIIEDGLDKFLVVRPKMSNFKTIKDMNKEDKSRRIWGEGVFGIKKDLFLGLNGFEGWRVAADSDFLARLNRNRAKIWSTNDTLFYRRVHPESLTMALETGFRSNMRMEYAKISKNKTYFGPLASLATSDYLELDLQNVYDVNYNELIIKDEDYRKSVEYKEKKKIISNILNNENIKPKFTSVNKPDYDKINKTLIQRQNIKSNVMRVEEKFQKGLRNKTIIIDRYKR